jgi:hypothetical protein
VVLAFEVGTAGTSVSATGTGIATAIAAGMISEVGPCGVEAAGSADESAPADALALCSELPSLDESAFVALRGAAVFL